MKKNTEKINHFKVVCYWGFRDPPTLLYAISIQKNIDNSGRPLRDGSLFMDGGAGDFFRGL